MNEDLTKPKLFPYTSSNEVRHSDIFEKEDDINLIDIYKILTRRKFLILLIVALTTLIGTLYAVLKNDIFNYTAVFQIGTLSINGTDKPLAYAKNTVSEANELVIPTVLNAYYSEHPEQEKKLSILASNPKESELVVLSAKSTEKDADLYKTLLTDVGNKLMSEQNKKSDEYKAQLSVQISNAKSRIQALLAAENEINKKIDGFQKLFKTKPIDNSGTTTLVITELFGQLQTNNREKYNLESQISNLEADLKLTSRSRYLIPVTRSLEPVNADKKIVIISSILVGLFLGVIAALTFNFVEKVKTELDSSN